MAHDPSPTLLRSLVLPSRAIVYQKQTHYLDFRNALGFTLKLFTLAGRPSSRTRPCWRRLSARRRLRWWPWWQIRRKPARSCSCLCCTPSQVSAIKPYTQASPTTCELAQYVKTRCLSTGRSQSPSSYASVQNRSSPPASIILH